MALQHDENGKSMSTLEKPVVLCQICCAKRAYQDMQKKQDVVFSDIFEVSLADRTKVRGCFALVKHTRHILALAFDYSMRADLVVSTINMIQFPTPGTIFHSDQGSQYGAEQTRAVLLEKGFIRSMSRAGTRKPIMATPNALLAYLSLP